MKIVYKYLIPNLGPVSKIQMPKGAVILTANYQGKSIYLWAESDKEETETQEVLIEIFAEGFTIPEGVRVYINTVFDRKFVFHIYQLL